MSVGLEVGLGVRLALCEGVFEFVEVLWCGLHGELGLVGMEERLWCGLGGGLLEVGVEVVAGGGGFKSGVTVLMGVLV